MNTIELVYKNDDFLIINKPVGILVHGTHKREHGTVVDWLLQNYPEVKKVGDDPKERPGIVHRLDRDTSGLMIVCRTQAAFDYFKKQFQEQKIKKIYLAIVAGVPKNKEGTIDKPIGLKPDTTKRTVHTKKAKMVKEAVTNYKVKKILRSAKNDYALLEVQPLTGRTHQIRVHLASIGYPIVGDSLYGNQQSARLMLHAAALEFAAPNGERLKIESEIPKEFTVFLDSVPK